jgi:hypothetical protein
VLHTVSLINASTVVTDVETAAIARALQRQVNRDYRPIWGTNAAVVPVFRGQPPPPGTWWLVILDDMDVAGALGYHDLTSEGLPIGKVGAKTDLEFGAKVSVTCSHELLEMLGDPEINLLVEDPDAGRLYAYENCDAVESDDLAYEVLGQMVSDFVLPAYFNPYRRGNEPLSFRGNVSNPFELAPGGYLSYREVGDSAWKQVFAKTRSGDLLRVKPGETAPERQERQRKPGFPAGSRRQRRLKLSEGKGLERSNAHIVFDA